MILMIAFFILLILVILYAREIRFIIALVFLAALLSAVWEFWWGKAISVVLAVLIVSGIVATVRMKLGNSNSQEFEAENDSQKRERAFLQALSYWTEEKSEEADQQIECCRRWRRDPHSEPELEEWYQENISSF